jgi:L-arabinose isomerase
MIAFRDFEVWFVTGSQHLYGDETLRRVREHSEQIGNALDTSAAIPVRVVFKPVLTTPDAIHQVCREANTTANCVGLIAWMHTFSPAKMWIAGLQELRKPFLHLHTQFNRDIPWAALDMDFMNLNQSAHGGREFGFICSRMGLRRKVVVGHWEDSEVHERVGVWTRAACAWHDGRGARFARFGDNMREVAVTEGDKVAAQMTFGWSVNGYGLGDLAAHVQAASDSAVDRLVAVYEDQYDVGAPVQRGAPQREAVREAARIELGLRAFLEQGGFKGFTTTFEDLHGLAQLPGLSVQRLMADGYGFGAEGDWKTAALVRAMKVMAHDRPGGTSFMEDYTYHLEPGNMMVLGAHMLEICPSIANGKPSLEVHPLAIGGKPDPARLVFTAPPGPAVNASLIDLGARFRLIVNEVDVLEPEAALPKLPVARALWAPKPDLKTAAAAWIQAGGAHHTGFSQGVTTEFMQDYADMAGIEMVVIGPASTVADVQKELRWNEAYYGRR